MPNKDRKLYNYIVNTLGVSKQMVLDYAKERVEDLLAKHIESRLNSNYVENLILNRVTQIVNEGVSAGFYDRTSFESYVKKCVYNVVEQKLKDDYELQTKIIVKRPKDFKGANHFISRPEEE